MADLRPAGHLQEPGQILGRARQTAAGGALDQEGPQRARRAMPARLLPARCPAGRRRTEQRGPPCVTGATRKCDLGWFTKI
jgi:hypothetical protein